ncbi:RNA binding protein [Cryptosporidium canis]|uniref:RNA binding protein n=1 Tax=Cryptosporidium canis TaxID=195482 RepID=A0ABQ8PAL5_9CRYT|nr:RNA binding protein [Cryptosporidium canis]KAJ1613964.1 RNA binding protein [Cryptosporidium canis]
MFRSGPYSQCIVNSNGERIFFGSDRQTCQIRSQIASKNPCQEIVSTTIGDSLTETYISRTIYLCKLPYDMTEDSVRELCEPFGDLKKVSVYPRKGIAFVEYFDIRKAEGARNTLKSSLVQGRIIDAQYSRGRASRDTNTGTLYIKPIIGDHMVADPNTEDDYKELFCAYGDVKKVSSNRKRESEKFVEFYDIRGAEASQKALNGYDFNGVILEIQFANTHSRTLNSDPNNLYNRNCCVGKQSLRTLIQRKYNGYPSLSKQKNSSNKCDISKKFERLVSKDLSHCGLNSDTSGQYSNRNLSNVHPGFNLLYQPSMNIQSIHSSDGFKRFTTTDHRNSDNTRTGNIAESLKSLLSAFKDPMSGIGYINTV